MKDYIPSRSLPKDHGKKRGKSPYQFRTDKRKYTHWYNQKPNGTQEELEEAFRVSETYLFKILDYAEKDELISKEKLEEYRRIFAISKQGPKARHLLSDNRSKLVSADILYILTTTLPASHIAKRYELQVDEVRRIRRGESPTWDWEYRFVKRIKGMIKGRMIQQDIRQRIYSVSKVLSPDKKEILIYTTSHRKAKELRESIIPKMEMYKLIKNKSLDIIYPIELIEVI